MSLLPSADKVDVESVRANDDEADYWEKVEIDFPIEGYPA